MQFRAEIHARSLDSTHRMVSCWELFQTGNASVQALYLNISSNFLKSAVEVEIITESPVSDKASAFNTGLYNFIVEGKTLKARFSFGFVKNDSGWK